MSYSRSPKIDGLLAESVDIRKPLSLEMEFWNLQEGSDLLCAFSFFDEEGTLLFVSPDWHEPKWGSKERKAGIFRGCCFIPGNFLAEGEIRVCAEVSTRQPYQIHFLEKDAVAFQVVDKREPGSVAAGWGRSLPGVIRPMLDWENEYIGAVDQLAPAPALEETKA